MWYPSKAQWCVIAIAEVIAYFCAVNDTFKHGILTAFFVLICGALLVWQLSRRPAK